MITHILNRAPMPRMRQSEPRWRAENTLLDGQAATDKQGTSVKGMHNGTATLTHGFIDVGKDRAQHDQEVGLFFLHKNKRTDSEQTKAHASIQHRCLNSRAEFWTETRPSHQQWLEVRHCSSKNYQLLAFFVIS